MGGSAGNTFVTDGNLYVNRKSVNFSIVKDTLFLTVICYSEKQVYPIDFGKEHATGLFAIPNDFILSFYIECGL